MSYKKTIAANRYLWFRSDARDIWFRMVVPTRYRSIRTAPVFHSLGTSDVHEARRLRDKRRAELIEEWEAALFPGLADPDYVPTEHDLDDAAVAIHDLILDDAQATARLFSDWDPDLWDVHVDTLAKKLKLHRTATARKDYDLIRPYAVEANEALGFNFKPESPEFRLLCDKLNSVAVAAMKVSHAHARGEVEVETDSKIVQRVRERKTRAARPGETILELFEDYGAEKVASKKKRPAGVDQDRMVVRLFAEFVGLGRAVGTIVYEDAKAFVDAIARLPSGYKKKREYRGLSIHEAIEKGMRNKVKTNSLITQERYISGLSPFFDWLKGEQGGRRIPANPFDGLHKDTSKLKRANPRPPFTAEQITTIIQSPLFTGFLADGKEHMPGNTRADDWRYWLPLICLFTGARIGEVAQLHVDDVYRDQGIWCVELRHDEGAGQRTKNDRCRSIALHSTLIAIGFLNFIERQRQRRDRDRNPQLFPELKPSKRHQYGDEPSDWWRDYLVAINVKSPQGSDGFGSHSFRHTISDQLRAAGYLDQVFGPIIMGHSTSSTSVTGGYGQSRQGTPQLCQQMIDSVKFVPILKGKVVEGGKPVDFSHLITATKG